MVEIRIGQVNGRALGPEAPTQPQADSHPQEEGVRGILDNPQPSEPAQAPLNAVIEVIAPLMYMGSKAVQLENHLGKTEAYELEFKAVVSAGDYASIVAKVQGHKIKAQFLTMDGAGEV